MNIVERGKEFVQSLLAQLSRSIWDQRRCPYCGDTLTCKYGSYTRHPWYLDGRREVRVQRHWCHHCRRTYSERWPCLLRGSWYAREVHRKAIDLWQHVGGSVRRVAELLRSELGRQERWLIWRPWEREPSSGERCYLVASTVQRWVQGAGKKAKEGVAGQLAGVPTSGQVGVDGLWARFRGGAQGVLLALVDSVSGLIWPPVVAGCEEAAAWQRLFERGKEAGLDLDALRGVVSDRASGLRGYLNRTLTWVNVQHCVWHLWRSLSEKLARCARQAAVGLKGAAAQAAREQARQTLAGLLHSVLDTKSREEAREAWRKLLAEPLGATVQKMLAPYVDTVLTHLCSYNRGLSRVAPEWYWRDFRLRLSRGRNHGTEEGLERAGLLWAVYRNFTPAQWRSERKRQYKHPGQSPLEVAGIELGGISYLDALGI